MQSALKGLLTDSINRKLAVTVAVAALVIFSVMMFFTVTKATGQVSTVSKNEMEAKSEALSYDMNTRLKKYQKLSDSLATTMGTYDKESASREEANETVRSLAEDNPNVLGVYVAYETGDFDGNDTEFAPYWNRYGGELGLINLKLGQDDKWYHRPMDTGEAWVKGPYSYKGKLLVSFLTPIKRNGETVGVAGVDISIDYMNEMVSKAQPTESGYAFVVSNDGEFVAHPNDSWVGSKTLDDVAKSQSVSGFQSMREGVEAGESGNFTMMDPVTGSNAFVEYQPIETGGFGVATVAPKDEVLAGVHNLRNVLVAISGVSLLVLIGIVVVITKRITGPIEDVRDLAKALARGDLDEDVDSTSRSDEIGELKDSFADMQSNLRAIFDEVDAFSTDLAEGADELQTRDVDTGFPGAYGEVMENLDRGATEVVGSLEEIRAASVGLQNGHLEQDIDTDRPGSYGEILTAFDDGMTTLSTSFDEISAASEGLTRGDLAQELDTSYPGEYGTVLSNIQDSIDHLSASVETVQEVAEEVAVSSEQVSASAEEIETASEEVAESVEEISHGAETQSENLQEVANEMNDMSATVEEVASSADEVAMTASTAVDRSETGREHAAEATDEIAAIESRADEAASQVRALDDEMEAIGEIVDMITEIAEQTNMLALNASIEAARAGEAGEGFGVVADEIKSLAEEAGEATVKIEERIETVQETTDQTVSGMEEMRDRVETGAETIEDAIQMFDEIATSVQEAEDGITEISAATDDQAASAEEVVSMVDEISSTSQQTASEASSVSAATEEQTASLSEATENIEHLSQLAEELHDQVATFDVQGDAAAAGAAGAVGSVSRDSTDQMQPDGGADVSAGREDHR